MIIKHHCELRKRWFMCNVIYGVKVGSFMLRLHPTIPTAHDWPIIPTSHYSDSPLFRQPTIGPLFRHPTIPTAHYSNGPLFRQPTIPTAHYWATIPTSHYSDIPLFRHPTIPTPQYSAPQYSNTNTHYLLKYPHYKWKICIWDLFYSSPSSPIIAIFSIMGSSCLSMWCCFRGCVYLLLYVW